MHGYNRVYIGREKTKHKLKIWDFVTKSIVWLSYERFNVAYISTHPLQCSFFSAVSVVERFEVDLTAKVQKLNLLIPEFASDSKHWRLFRKNTEYRNRGYYYNRNLNLPVACM